MKIYSKIHNIQKGLIVHKDKRNEFLKNAYVTLDQIVEKLEPLLGKENLFMFHSIVDRELVTHIVDIEWQEELVSNFPMNATDPQKAWSEITYGKRYNLSAIFNIIADEDDDWNKASGIWAKKPPIRDDVPQVPTTPTKPYITSSIITLMIQDVKEGKIQVSSADSLIELLRRDYKVASGWAEKEIRAKYDTVDKSKQI